MTRSRWGIFGTGQVARKFAIALSGAPGAELAFVASRSRARAEAFAGELRAQKAVEGYEAAAAEDVDVIYVATPPSEHRVHALTAIAGGKAVLIEKPLASSIADAEAIVAAARKAKVFCMEAMWTRFVPAVTLARTLIAAGVIGEPRGLQGSFGIAQVVEPNATLFNPALGGGALAHRGIYPLSLALDLLGPATLSGARAVIGETAVDEDVSAVLSHACGAVSSLYASLRASAPNDLIVEGTEGRLRLVGPVFRPHAVEIVRSPPRRSSGGGPGQFERLKEGALLHGLRQRLGDPASLAPGRRSVRRAPYAGNGYRHEIEAVAAALEAGSVEDARMTLDQSLEIAQLMAQILKTGAAYPRRTV